MYEEIYKKYEGKVCTISTVQINFRFKEEQMMDYYMGTVEKITDKFVIITHPQTKCETLIRWKYIVAIAVEQVLFEENPEHAKVIEEFRKEKPVTAAKTALMPTKSFVDPKAMAELAKKAQDKYPK